jgi:hypothetical protein
VFRLVHLHHFLSHQSRGARRDEHQPSSLRCKTRKSVPRPAARRRFARADFIN